MRNLFIGFLLSLVAVACTSETKEVFLDGEELLPPIKPVEAKTRCCQAAMTTGDSIAKLTRSNSRGWGAPAGPVYPLDYVYVVSDVEDDIYEDGKYDPDEYKPIQSDKVVKMPVMNNPDVSSMDLCFQFGEGAGPKDDPNDDDDDEVYITVDGKVIEVEDCIFSSVPLAEAKMEQSDTITTPGQPDVKVYEPFGDNLFLSDYFEIEYDYKKDKLMLETVSYDENGNEVTTKGIEISSSEHVEIPLKRYTTVINSKLMVSELTSKGDKKLTLDEFEEVLGDTADWRVRVFINNAPTTFNYSHMYHFPDGNDIIALSKDSLTFYKSQSHSHGGKKYIGIGAEDTSEPHIFPMKVKADTEICYSFYYKGNKEITFTDDKKETVTKPILKHTTIRVPINYGSKQFTQLEANTKYFLTHMIDIEDFKKGVTGYYDKSRSMSSDNYDPLFGYVMDIPCKTSVEVRK